jgi:micrococcal nuclease
MFLNAHLVKEGYATAATFPPNVKYVELFTKLEREARNKGKGLWAK